MPSSWTRFKEEGPMRSSGGIVRRSLAMLALVSVVVPFTAGPAHAVEPLPIACTAAGTVTFEKVLNGGVKWTLIGKGSCQGDLEGTYFLDFTGTGTSDTAALCDATFVVQNLNVNITGTLTNAATLAVKVIRQTWSAPATTYPLATPFLIQTSDGNVGAGTWFNHIFLQCTGSPVAQFDFAWLT
jgi:hypothetical protein